MKDITLLDSDQFEGLPLLLTWGLATVDQRLQNYCRIQLTKWGSSNPEQFIKLLNLTFVEADPQMQQDLMTIVYGIACLMEKDDASFGDLVKWIDVNIFRKIDKYHNAVVRHAGRASIERAYFYKIVTEDVVQRARPPYCYAPELMKIDLDVAVEKSKKTKTGRDFGFGPIDSDLAWYVIEKAYSPFFKRNWYTRELSFEAQEFLSSYKIDSLNP